MARHSNNKKGVGSGIGKPCAVCDGELLVARIESRCKRALTCLSKTVISGSNFPSDCVLNSGQVSEDSLAAMKLITDITRGPNGKRRKGMVEQHVQILVRYIADVGSGEPPVKWYREVLQKHSSKLVHKALSELPYWRSDNLRLMSLIEVGPIDRRVNKLRSETNADLADLLGAWVESRYELMHFTFEKGLHGKSNPIKISTIKRDVDSLAAYLEWIFVEGHESIQTAGRSVVDEYLADRSSGSASAGYLISRFYRWVKQTHPFTPNINFSRRRKGAPHTHFETLSLKESQEAFQRICAHPEPYGKALALMALLYAQKAVDSVDLKLSDLKRDPTSGQWLIAKPEVEPYAIEKELSDALDECLALTERNISNGDDGFVFVQKMGRQLSAQVARPMIKRASGVNASRLRRSAIINMYRGGQKTLGTVVLRDILNVSSPTIRRAIKATGESVNAPTLAEEADALRRSFLEDDD